MKLICVNKPYTYGHVPKLSKKQALDNDLDVKDYHGGPVETFKPGSEYEMERDTALRLLRDYGPKRGRTDVRFLPADQTEYIEYLTQGTNTIPMDAVLAGALAARDESATKNVDVDA